MRLRSPEQTTANNPDRTSRWMASNGKLLGLALALRLRGAGMTRVTAQGPEASLVGNSCAAVLLLDHNGTPVLAWALASDAPMLEHAVANFGFGTWERLKADPPRRRQFTELVQCYRQTAGNKSLCTNSALRFFPIH